MRRHLLSLPAALLLGAASLGAQGSGAFTHADTLRGTNGPARAWWDAEFDDLHVTVSPADSSIRGWNGITYRVLRPAPGRLMQIDLQQPLEVDSMVQDGRKLAWRRDGNAYFVTLAAAQPIGARKTVTVHYHGKPRAAKHAPWDGGFVWARDSSGGRWIATANEGLGASVWWPLKDHLADEPDSQRIAITLPDSVIDVSNGRLRSVDHHADGTTTWEWFVTSPINSYDVAVNAARYAHLSDLYEGEQGTLTLDYWPLAIHADTARVQFRQVKPMLACFEHWFGPYPWYEDGYKLVETPHLGMEHQSAVAYGNHYKNGYLGRDLSGTGLGMSWDFIIVHESGHEWFGNSVTMQDQADMWIHEGFTSYSEGLFVECQQGKEAGARYLIGLRHNIRNDEPITPPYGVNAEGSGDMYYKGSNMLHTIRQLVNDDERWRGILRGIQRTFRHRTVTARQVEDYMSRESGIDLSRVFAQYLTTTRIPVLEYALRDSTLSYRWANVVPGFDMPVRVTTAPGTYTHLKPTEHWQTTTVHLASPAELRVDESFYVTAKDVGPAAPRP